MTSKWFRYSLLIGLAMTLTFFGCSSSSDDDDNNPTAPSDPGTLTITLTDATTGDPIVGAFVVLSNPHEGYTDDNGQVTFADVSEGEHTITITHDDYATYSTTVEVTGGEFTDFFPAMSPESDADFRIILSWGQEPHDLDNHLETPAIEGTAYHIYYPSSNRGDLANPPYAYLDRDDVESYGPETITIQQTYPGIYYSYIYNWSGEPDLAGCGARVQLYQGNDLLHELTIPQEGTGEYWDLFRIDGTTSEVTVINAIATTDPGPLATVWFRGEKATR